MGEIEVSDRESCRVFSGDDVVFPMLFTFFQVACLTSSLFPFLTLETLKASTVTLVAFFSIPN